MPNKEYRYTESGLENIYLTGGIEFVDGPRGKQIVIDDIEGLHKEIGLLLVNEEKNLAGKEIRFLRTEMGCSQRELADLLDVSEQALRRWEKSGRAPKPAETLIRLLYKEHIGDPSNVRTILREIKRMADRQADDLTATKNSDVWVATRRAVSG